MRSQKALKALLRGRSQICPFAMGGKGSILQRRIDLSGPPSIGGLRLWQRKYPLEWFEWQS